MLRQFINRAVLVLLVVTASAVLEAGSALALPAFAMRENAPCELCHVNGSAPHLTRYGYMYRRAGYRNPAMIGNNAADLAAMELTKHMAVGVTVDYEWASRKARGDSSATATANQFDARELEIWPLVGAFQGNIGVFSEIDASPVTTSSGPNGAGPGGGLSVTHMELTYVKGDAEKFFSFRSGLIGPQGYGASDQWLDDGNLPLFDSLTAQYNQDTLTMPLGANNVPQLGAEIGVSLYSATYATIGTYNGLDGTSGLATKTQSALNPVLTNGYNSSGKDYKAQIDEFIGSGTALTAVYYRGTISLLDPTNTEVWQNHYSTWRLYLTQSVTDGADVLAGAANGMYEYLNAAPDTTRGSFMSPGAFLALNKYFSGHLTASARYDTFAYSRFQGDSQQAKAAGLMLGFPLENTLVNLHYKWQRSDIDGLTRDFRAEWRLIF